MFAIDLVLPADPALPDPALPDPALPDPALPDPALPDPALPDPALPEKPAESAQLRPLEPWQAEEFLAHMDRARATVDPWIPWASVSTDLASARQTLQRYADKRAADTGQLLGIWLDGKLVGGTMFVAFNAADGTAEVGCWLEPDATGRGLITQAVRLLIDWAFRVRGLHRIEWHCDPRNIASSNIARRLGMRLEGTLRESYLWQGTRRDTEIWAILASEWP